MRICISLVLLGSILVSCSPSEERIKAVIRDNPDLVFGAIEEHPEKFIATVNRAAKAQQRRAQEEESQKAVVQMEAEFKNPKKPEIDEARILFGGKAAPVTIVEYGDLQCPACRHGYFALNEIKKKYKDKIRIIYKHMPLSFHKLAMPAAQYFEAIARQDRKKALSFHDKIFENQKELKNKAYLEKVAKSLKLDWKKLSSDLKSSAVEKRIQADMEEFSRFGYSGTPVYLINGVSLQGAYPAEAMAEVIDRHLSNMGKNK